MHSLIRQLTDARHVGGGSWNCPEDAFAKVRAGFLRLITQEAEAFEKAKAAHWNVEYGVQFLSYPDDERTPQLSWSLAAMHGPKEGWYQLRLHFPNPDASSDTPSWRGLVSVEAVFSDEELARSGFWTACDESGLTDHLAALQNARSRKLVRAAQTLLAERGLLSG
jgi:hypothetical protein